MEHSFCSKTRTVLVRALLPPLPFKQLTFVLYAPGNSGDHCFTSLPSLYVSSEHIYTLEEELYVTDFASLILYSAWKEEKENNNFSFSHASACVSDRLS